MARFQGRVTQEGWSFDFETSVEDRSESTAFTSNLGERFIQAQTTLQAEGQKFVRETLGAEGKFEEANGEKVQVHAEEAETLSDSQIPENAS